MCLKRKCGHTTANSDWPGQQFWEKAHSLNWEKLLAILGKLKKKE
jgi:hypothetical protein